MSIIIDWNEYAVEGVVKGTNERIKVIDNFPTYFVSTEGRVLSSMGRGITCPNFDNLREMPQQRPKGGTGEGKEYWQVCLYNGNKRLTSRIHNLVAKAFIPNPNNLPIVNHLKYPSNRVEDLEWNTQQGNCEHGENSKDHLIQFPDGSVQKIRSLANFLRTVVIPGFSSPHIGSLMDNFRRRKTPLNGYKFIKTLEP